MIPLTERELIQQIAIRMDELKASGDTVKLEYMTKWLKLIVG